MTLKKLTKVVGLVILFSIACFAESINLVGKLSVIGNVPFTRLVCDTKEQQRFILEGDLLDELNNLQSTTVRVEGTQVSSASEYGLPVLKVEKYELLAVGEGENQKTPSVGFIRIQGNSIYLESLSNKSYLLKGPLIKEIKHFEGSKVWITGEIKPPSWFLGKSSLTAEAFRVIKKPKNNPKN